MIQMRAVLEGVYSNPELRKTIIPLFISHPGVGKTKIIEQFAKEKGVNLIEIIASQVSPFEISGICVPSHTKEKMVYYDFDRIENLKSGDILFFDELLAANPVTLSACLTLLEQRRTISGKDLPDIMIVAAANPQNQTPLSPAIKERFIYYDIKFDRVMWIEYMTKKYQITKTIGDKLSTLIEKEDFSGRNFYTPRSVDKAISMVLKNVHTPYEDIILPILSELVKNRLTEDIDLGNGRVLAPNELISWVDLMRLKNNIIIDKIEIPLEEEIIPENWYIKVTLDNFDEINKYYEKIMGLVWVKSTGYTFSKEPYWEYNKVTRPDNVEITIEDLRTNKYKII